MREQLSSMPGLWMNEKHPSARRPAIPPPRGTPNQTFGPVFWLAFNLLQRLPMREHSGVLRSCQAYSSGGCTGISAKQSTGFPFHPLHGRRARHPKRPEFYFTHLNLCKRIRAIAFETQTSTAKAPRGKGNAKNKKAAFFELLCETFCILCAFAVGS